MNLGFALNLAFLIIFPYPQIQYEQTAVPLTTSTRAPDEINGVPKVKMPLKNSSDFLTTTDAK